MVCFIMHAKPRVLCMAFDKRLHILAATCVLTLCCHSVYANPDGADVVAGGAVTDYAAETKTLTVTTSTERTIINWRNHDIAADEITRYQQPSAASVTLSRVIDGNPTRIMGGLQSNGQVFIVNPNGVLFGRSARVDLPGLLASTLDIKNEDFLNGRYRFFDTGGKGRVVNMADLTALPGGYICLLSKSIENDARIEARTGTIALAAGEAMTVAMDDNSLISVAVDESVRSEVLGDDGTAVKNAIDNKGEILAAGGKVILTARVFKHVFDHAINNSGIISAKSLLEHDGIVELSAQGAAITNTGTIEATQVSLAAAGAPVNNGGIITAEKTVDIKLDGSPLTNTGTMAARQGVFITAIGLDGTAQRVDLTAPDLSVVPSPVLNTGTIAAPKILIQAPILMNGPTGIINTLQLIAQPSLIKLDLDQLLQQGRISANGIDGLDAGDIVINVQSDVLFDNGSSTEAAAPGLIGQGGRILISAKNAFVKEGARLDISAGSLAGNGGVLSMDVLEQLGFYGILNGRAPPGYRSSMAFLDPATADVSGDFSVDTIIDATGDIRITGNVNFYDHTLTLLADHNNNTTGNWHDGVGAIAATGDFTLKGVSGSLLLYAGSGIGSSASPLKIDAGTLRATTRSGGIYLSQDAQDALTLAGLDSNGSDIKVTSPKALNVKAGAVISTRQLAWLADPLTALSTGNSGDLTLESTNLTAEADSRLLANADSGFTSGSITLTAHDTTGLVTPIVQIKTTDARITLNGAIIKGGAVSIQATADSTKMFDDTATATDTTIDALESISVLAGVAISQATAAVNMNAGTQITASSLQVASTAKSEATVRTLSTALGVAYGRSDASAQAIVGSGVTVNTTGKTDISASADNKVSVSAWTVNLGKGRGSAVDLCLAVGQSSSDATAQVASGATLTTGTDLNVKANVTRELSVSALGGAYEDGSVGVGVAVSTSTSNADAFLDGTATTGGAIIVKADSNTPKNDTSASAAAGSGMVAKLVIKAANAAVDGVQKLFGSKKPGGDPRSQSQPLSLSAAFMYADHTNNATARIGDAAVVKAQGLISVTATVSEVPEVSAVASVDSTDENKKKNAVAGAVVVSYFHNNASAYIGKAAEVNARGALTVKSETLNPYEIQWATISGVSDITDKLNPNLGIQNGFFTSWAQSNAAVTDIGIAGSVVLFSIENNSSAFIDENAAVNQDAAYRSGAQTVTVEAKNDIQSINLSGVFGLKGPGTSAGKTGIGGSYLEVDYTGNVKAMIKDGARVYGDGITVKAGNTNRNISIAESGGKAGQYSINATFSLLGITDTTYAQIDDGAAVNAGSGAVLVDSQDNSQIYNIAGGITKGGNVGIGASVSLNDIIRDTQAVIGNIGVQPDAAGSLTTTGAITLNAFNHGGIDSYSLAAAMASGSSDSGNPATSKEAPGGGGKYGISISGDVSINDIQDTTVAGVYDADILNAASISMNATDNTGLQAYAGSVALSGSSSTSVGLAGSFTWNKLAYTTTTAIGHANVHTTGDITMGALTAGELDTVAAGASVAWKSSGIAVAGTVTLNELANATNASISRGSIVTGRNMALSALDATKLMSVAGTLSYGGKAGVGASVALNYDTSGVLAYIADSDVTATGNILASAVITPDILSVAASLVASKGNLALNAAVAVSDLDNQARAYISGYKTTAGVSADGNISLTAVDDMKFLTVAGEVAVALGSSGGGIGGANSTLMNDTTVEAYIGAGSIVNAKGNAPAVAVLTGQKVAGTRQAENAAGLSLVAASYEDITTIAAGGSGGGSVGIAASAPVTLLNQFTRAYIAANASVNQAAGAGSDQSVNILASDTTGMLGIGGALAFGKNAGVGAGADVAVINKTTEAYIGQAATVGAQSNILVRARNIENFDSVAGSLAGGKSAGIAGAASVYVVTDITRAYIAPYAQVMAEGSILLTALDQDEYDLIDATAQFGQAGIGAGAGVLLLDKTTEAYVAANAHVNARGREDKAGLDVPTGAFVVSYVPNTTADGEVSAPGVSNVNISNQALTSQRTSAAQTRNIRGLGIAAISKDDIEIIAAGAAVSSSLSIEGSAVVNLLTNRTHAYIGEGAMVNDLATPSASQSILIAAANDYYHMAIAGAVSLSGSCGIGPAATVSIVNNDALAYIASSAHVRANNDIAIAANQSEDVLSIAAVLAGGGEVGIAGAVVYNALNDHTYAYIGSGTAVADRAVVWAGNDLSLAALDESHYDIIAGSAGIGFGTAGAGGSVSVDNIAKDTKAYIGNFAKVDAGANGADTVSVYTGLLDASGNRMTKLIKGVSIQARSAEDVLHIVASGAGGLYGGLAGAVAVTTIGSSTQSWIGNNTAVNVGTGAGAAQAVNLAAINDLKTFTVDGSLAVGLVGVSGAVDVASINNDTAAYIGNDSVVFAAHDIDINAFSTKDISSYAISASAGGAGVAGGVALYNLGTKLTSQALDTMKTGDGTSGTAYGYVDGQVASGLTGSLFAGYSDTHVSGAGTRVHNATQAYSLTGKLTATVVPGGVAAFVADRATVTAGGALALHAHEKVKFYVLTGGGAAAASGIGGAVGILNFKTDALAYIGNDAMITTDGDIVISADLKETIENRSYAGSMGTFGNIGATVSLIDDKSNSAAYIGSGTTVVKANNITLSATSDHDQNSLALGGAGSLMGPALSGAVVYGYNSGFTRAFINTLAIINAGGNITLNAVSVSKMKAAVYAPSLGMMLAAGAALAVLEDTSTTTSSINNGARIEKAGAVVLVAAMMPQVSAEAWAGGAGIVAGGVGYARARVTGSVKAFVEDNVEIGMAPGKTAGALSLTALLEIPHDASGAAVDTAYALAMAGSLGILGGNGSDAAAEVTPAVEATIGNSAGITTTGAVTLKAKARDSVTADAEGVAVSGIGSVGVALAAATMGPRIKASIGTDAYISAGAPIELGAWHNFNDSGDQLDRKAYAYTLSGSGSLIAAGSGADADASANASVQALIGSRSTVNSPTASITLGAYANNRSKAQADGFSVALGAGVGASLADATSKGTVSASSSAASITANALTIGAEAYDYADADTLSGAGGILAGGGSTPSAYAGSTVTAASTGTVFTVAAMKVNALAKPNADAYAKGIAGGLVAVGVSQAYAEAKPIVSASATGNIRAANVTVSAAADLTPGLDAAASDAFGSSGSLVGVNATSARSVNTSTVNAYIGDNSVLTVAGTTYVHATGNTRQYARATGKFGALIALGDNEAWSGSNSTVNAYVGHDAFVGGGATLAGTLTITADGTDDNYAECESGSGGIIAGAASTATTRTNGMASAYIGSGDTTQTASAGRNASLAALNITVDHNARFNAKSSSINASVVGLSGAYADNKVAYVSAAGVGDGADIQAKSIQMSASNRVTKDYLPGGAYNVESGSGGVIDAPAGQSLSHIGSSAVVNVGQHAFLYLLGDFHVGGTFKLEALNDIRAYDKAKLDSGGAIAIAKSESLIYNDASNAMVNVGDYADMYAIGDIILGARARVDIRTTADAKTYGLAGAAEGYSAATTAVTNRINIGYFAKMKTEWNIRLGAGTDATALAPLYNDLYVNAYTDLWNKTALPIETHPDADGNISQTDTINISGGASLQSVKDTYLLTEKGAVSATGYGRGKDLYREVLAAIASFFSNLFGGGDVSLDIEGGATRVTSSRGLMINGAVKAGIKNQMIMVFNEDGTLNMSETSEELRSDSFTTTSETLSNTIQAKIDALNTLITNLQSDLGHRLSGGNAGASAYAALSAEITSLNNQVASLTTSKNNADAAAAGFKATYDAKVAAIAALDAIAVASRPADWAAQRAARVSERDSANTSYQSKLTESSNALAEINTVNGTIATKQTQLGAMNPSGGEALDAVSLADLIGAYQAEKAYWESQQGRVGTGTASVINITKPIWSQSSNIHITGDYLVGRGTLDAPGDAQISITNKSASFLRTGEMTIPDTQGGRIFFNYVPVTSNGTINSRNAFGYAATFADVFTSANTASLIAVKNTYIPSGADIYVDAAITNLGGTVDIDSSRGSVMVKNGVNIFARTIKLSAFKDIFLGYVEGIRNVSGDIKVEWSGVWTPYQTASWDYSSGAKTVQQLLGITSTAGSLIAGNNIFMSAQRINVNGTVQSGLPDRTVLIGADIGTTIAALVTADPTKTRYVVNQAAVDADKSTVAVFYVPNVPGSATDGYLEVEPTQITGGYMELYGQILNTSLGKLNMIDGYGNITITNNSPFLLKVSTLDAGGNIEGQIKITDTGKHWSNGKAYVTLIERTGGQVTRKINQDGGELVLDTTTGWAPGRAYEDTGAAYDPAAHLYYTWTTESAKKYQQSYVHVDKYFIGINCGSSSWDTGITEVPYTDPPRFAQADTIATLPSHDEAFWFDYTYYRWATGWTWNSSWSDDYVVYWENYNKYVRDIYTIEVRNYNINASHSIPISFIGYDTASINVTSKGGVLLSAPVSNLSGAVNITSTDGALTQKAADATVLISAANASLNARTGIGSSLTPVRVQVTGKLDANVSGTGDINITGAAGDLTLGQVKANDGNVKLVSELDILANSSASLVKGKQVTLSASRGAIGTSSRDLRVDTGSSATADLVADAAGDIFLTETAGDLYLNRAYSLGGSVAITVASGSLFDNNANFSVDTRSTTQLDQVWADMGLMGAAAQASAVQTVDAYERGREREYQLYWSYRIKQADGGAAYDPAFKVTLSADEKAQLKVLDAARWTDTAIAGLEAERMQQYQQLHARYGGATAAFDPMWAYTVTADERAALTDGYSWTHDQLTNGISMGLLKEISDTEMRLEDANAQGNNVTLHARDAIGSSMAPVAISVTAGYASLGLAQRRALMAAERNDLEFIYDTAGNPSEVRITQREDVDVQADGYIDVRSDTGSVYLGSERDMNVQKIEAAGNIRVKTQQGIYAYAGHAAGPHIAGTDTILEAGGASIGTPTAPLVLALKAGALFTARADHDIYVEESARDLNIDTVYAPYHVWLSGPLSIKDGFNDALTNIRSGTLELVFLNGSIGTAANALEIGVNADGWVKAAASAAGGSIDLYSPQRDLPVADMSAGDAIMLGAAGNMVLRGAITAVDLTLDAAGTLTQAAGHYLVSNLIFDAQGNVKLDMPDNDAYRMQGRITAHPGWMHVYDRNDLYIDAIASSLIGASTVKGDVIITAAGHLTQEAPVSAHSDVILTAGTQLDVLSDATCDHNIRLTAGNDINIKGTLTAHEDIIMNAGGAITQDVTTLMAARGVSFSANGPVSLEAPANDAGTVAGKTLAPGDIRIKDMNNVEIGTVINSGLQGITAFMGNLFISNAHAAEIAPPSNIVISQPVSALGVNLNAADGIYQAGSGAVIAHDLVLRAGAGTRDDIVDLGGDNNVDNISAAAAGAGKLTMSYHDADDLNIASLDGLTGIDTRGGSLTLTGGGKITGGNNGMNDNVRSHILDVTAENGITLDVAVDDLSAANHARGDIRIFNTRAFYARKVNNDAGNVDLTGAHDMTVGDISGTVVNLTTTGGSLLDDLALDPDDTNAIRAKAVNLNAFADIGSLATNGDIDMVTERLSAIAGGDAFMEAAGLRYLGPVTIGGSLGMTVHGTCTLSSVQAGKSIRFVSTYGDLYLDTPGVTSLTRGIELTAMNGNIFAIGAGDHFIARADSIMAAANGVIGLTLAEDVNPVRVYVDGTLLVTVGAVRSGQYNSMYMSGWIKDGYPLLDKVHFVQPLYPFGRVYYNGERIWPSRSNNSAYLDFLFHAGDLIRARLQGEPVQYLGFLDATYNAITSRFLAPSSRQMGLFKVSTFDAMPNAGGVFFYHPVVEASLGDMEDAFLTTDMYTFIDGVIEASGKKKRRALIPGQMPEIKGP